MGFTGRDVGHSGRMGRGPDATCSGAGGAPSAARPPRASRPRGGAGAARTSARPPGPPSPPGANRRGRGLPGLRGSRGPCLPGTNAAHRAALRAARHVYVYFIYGMHHCLNLAVDRPGVPGCVLIRAVEPLGDPRGGRRARAGQALPLPGAGRARQRPVPLRTGRPADPSGGFVAVAHRGHDADRHPPRGRPAAAVLRSRTARPSLRGSADVQAKRSATRERQLWQRLGREGVRLQNRSYPTIDTPGRSGSVKTSTTWASTFTIQYSDMPARDTPTP